MSRKNRKKPEGTKELHPPKQNILRAHMGGLDQRIRSLASEVAELKVLAREGALAAEIVRLHGEARAWQNIGRRGILPRI